MSNSTIGTNKQTEAERLANLAALDKLDPLAPDENNENEDDEAGADVTPPADDVVVDKKPADDTTPPDDDKTPPADDVVDYQAKYSDSTREAQILALRNKTYQDKIDEAENLPDPTEDECIAEYGEAWDERDEFDKNIARQVLKDKRYKEIIRTVRKAQKEEEGHFDNAVAYAKDVEATNQFPALKGREEEFARFASKETRRGLNLEDVAAIFTVSRPVKRVVPKGAMMERSNANMDKTKSKPKTLDAQHASILRQTSPKAYEKAIRDGTFDPTKMEF